MMDFAERLIMLEQDLQAAGLSASLDPADVNPPGVLIIQTDLHTSAGKLCGTETLTLALALVVPDVGIRQANIDLARLAARVGPATRVAGLRITTDQQTFERQAMPDDPTGLPCLRITAATTYTATPPATAWKETRS
jgi:hypothetical protein